MSKARSRIIRLYAVIAAVILALFLFEKLFIDTRPFVADEAKSLTNLQEKAFDVYLEINRLLTTVTTLLFGALGALIVKRGERGERTATETVIWITAISASVSLYCGYVLATAVRLSAGGGRERW